MKPLPQPPAELPTTVTRGPWIFVATLTVAFLVLVAFLRWR